MEKDLSVTQLFDLYGGLLTERQRELFTSYYLYDLSLSEIAEPEGKTRQCVYESVKKVKEKLNEYEEILHLKEKFTAIEEICKGVDDDVAEKIKDIIGK